MDRTDHAAPLVRGAIIWPVDDRLARGRPLAWLALFSMGADWAGLHFVVGVFLAGAVMDAL